MLNKRRAILFLLALAVTGFFLWIFGGKLVENWPEVRKAFADGEWFWLAPATLMILLVFVLKGFRWQIIMNPLAKPGYWPLFSATSIGFMANCILPLRLGEIIRPGVLGVKYGVSTSGALATVVVERLFDMVGIVVVSMAGVAWLLVRRRGGPMGSGNIALAVVLAAVAIIAIGFLIMLRARPHWARAVAIIAIAIGFLVMLWARRAALLLLRWVPSSLRRRGEAVLDSFISGLTVIGSWKQWSAVLLLSILHWIMMGTMVYLTSLCFLHQTFIADTGQPQQFDLGIFGAFLVQAFQAPAVSIPQLPGFFGTHQMATTAASEVIFGAGAAGIAGAYAVVLWCVSILPVILLGFICLWFEGLSMRQVREMAGRPAER